MRIQLVYSFFSFRLTNFHRGQGLYFLEMVNSLQESLLCVRKLYMQADTCMHTRIQKIKVKITHRHSSRHIFILTHRYSSYILLSSQSTQTYLKRRNMRRKTVRVCTHCDTEKCSKHHYCATLCSCFHSITCHLTLHDCSWPDLGVNRSK
jgi:hypothetical protein